jgi:copper chaperone CopZ
MTLSLRLSNSIQDHIDNLPDEVKLTITAEDAATDTLERISESIEDATYTITIRADDEATDVINNVKEALEDLPGEYTVKIVADDEATGVVDDVKEALSSIPDEVRSVIDVDAGDSLKVIDDVANHLEEIDGTEATASISLEGSDRSIDEIKDVADRLEEIDGTDATASVSVEGTEGGSPIH